MGRDRRGIARRVGIALLLLGAVLLAGVQYDDAESRHLDQPTNAELDRNYRQYVGQDVLLFGTVVEREGGEVLIRVESEAGPFEMRVTGVSEGVSVEPGGTIQVYGAVQENMRIAAKNVVVVNESPASFTYKYLTSLAGVALFLAVFFSHWTVDPETLQIRSKENG